jgi:methylenetetrahydrofolate dehydrogenase (NADP+)/methenyltetrahydrofolate cyclohydrolase
MAQAALIDGKVLSAHMQAVVTAEVARLKAEHGLTPGLAVVLVGEDAASQVYVRSKGVQSEAAGLLSVTRRLPAETSQADLLAVVAELNADPMIHGLLVQFPVPDHISQADVVAAISPDKDVDGLTVINAGRLASGLPGLVPCTPEGCMIMIRAVVPDLKGKKAVVVGRSNLVGKPVAQLLLQADCTVTMAHSRTADLPAVCREADILVVAVGRAEMVRGDWIKPGAVVIDVGMNRVPSRDPEKAAQGKTRLTGDVAFEEAMEVASAVTPVPGGVGLMTVACLLANTVKAAKLIHGIGD